MKVFVPNGLIHIDNIRKVLRESDTIIECYNDGSVVAFDDSILEDFLTTLSDYTSLDENTIGNICELVEENDVQILNEDDDSYKTGSQIMNECVMESVDDLKMTQLESLIKITENLNLNTLNLDRMSYEELVSYRNTLSLTAKKLEDSIALIRSKLQNMGSEA